MDLRDSFGTPVLNGTFFWTPWTILEPQVIPLLVTVRPGLTLLLILKCTAGKGKVGNKSGESRIATCDLCPSPNPYKEVIIVLYLN